MHTSDESNEVKVAAYSEAALLNIAKLYAISSSPAATEEESLAVPPKPLSSIEYAAMVDYISTVSSLIGRLRDESAVKRSDFAPVP